jgi:hypothetical protein
MLEEKLRYVIKEVKNTKILSMHINDKLEVGASGGFSLLGGGALRPVTADSPKQIVIQLFYIFFSFQSLQIVLSGSGSRRCTSPPPHIWHFKNYK